MSDIDIDEQHIKECLSEMLSVYIGDERDYKLSGKEYGKTDQAVMFYYGAS